MEHHKNTATQRRLQSARLRRESALDTSTRLSRVATAGESRPAPKPFEGGDGHARACQRLSPSREATAGESRLQQQACT